MATTHWRQGDVLIAVTDLIPETAISLSRPILAVGGSTGQSHRVRDRRQATIYQIPGAGEGELLMHVTGETCDVIHPEHASITLPRGIYRVWRQREFSPMGTRMVAD